jgi:transcriptional regulator with PAS, ATPase and Fis domain
VNVRIVAATHRNLEKLVDEGKFREDLFYRLKVIEIEIPALRERKEDIPELSQVFLAKYSAKLSKKVATISKEGMQALMAYGWPGNVRELEHQIERAVAMTSASVLAADDFDFSSSRPVIEAIPAVATHAAISDPRSLEDMEKEHILRVLRDVDYNKSKASEVLGIDRATLYRKALKYGIALKNDSDK